MVFSYDNFYHVAENTNGTFSVLAGTTSLGSEQHPRPASTRMNTEITTSNRFTDNGGWVGIVGDRMGG